MSRQDPSNTMDNQGNKAAQKENKKSSESKLKDLKIYDLNGREFKIAVLKRRDARKHK